MSILNRYHGPVGRRAGFTLVELLIVIVIIGVLAAIALPKFGESRERAFVAGMRSDLRNLQTAMEMYYHNNMLSYDGAAISTPGLGFYPTDAVEITLATQTRGWSAVANHPAVSTTCAIFIGDAAAVAPATETGTVTCDGP